MGGSQMDDKQGGCDGSDGSDGSDGTGGIGGIFGGNLVFFLFLILILLMGSINSSGREEEGPSLLQGQPLLPRYARTDK